MENTYDKGVKLKAVWRDRLLVDIEALGKKTAVVVFCGKTCTAPLSEIRVLKNESKNTKDK